MKLFDEYHIKARLFPTIISSIPLLTLYYFGFSTKLGDYLEFLQNYKWTADITISVVIIYLFIQINRFISKELFQAFFFKKEAQMPTTNYLLHSNPKLAKSIKEKLTKKIKKLFKITLLDEQAEQADEEEARKIIITAVAQIRTKLKGNKMLFRHNVEYGFVRNLIGGCVVACIFSIISVTYFGYFSENQTAFRLSTLFLILYTLPIILSKVIIQRFGEYYANVLFEQFLVKEDK